MAEPNRLMVLRDLKHKYKNLSEEAMLKALPMFKAEIDQQ